MDTTTTPGHDFADGAASISRIRALAVLPVDPWDAESEFSDQQAFDAISILVDGTPLFCGRLLPMTDGTLWEDASVSRSRWLGTAQLDPRITAPRLEEVVGLEP